MKLASTVFVVSTLLATPAIILAQRNPDTQQQGTGQQSPDLAPSAPPSDKAGHPDTSTNPKTGEGNSNTQQQNSQGSHSGKKQKLKQHGGSHDQGTPQT
jgi:hypothetical protein